MAHFLGSYNTLQLLLTLSISNSRMFLFNRFLHFRPCVAFEISHSSVSSIFNFLSIYCLSFLINVKNICYYLERHVPVMKLNFTYTHPHTRPQCAIMWRHVIIKSVFICLWRPSFRAQRMAMKTTHSANMLAIRAKIITRYYQSCSL